MKRLVLAAAVLFASEAAAQQACVRPTAPVFPPVATASTLSQAQIEQHRVARDTYFTAADANLACMDETIDAKMKSLFATGAPMDAAMRQLGVSHQEASAERASVYERFLRLCIAWEDARHMPLPGGCAPVLQGQTASPKTE